MKHLNKIITLTMTLSMIFSSALQTGCSGSSDGTSELPAPQIGVELESINSKTYSGTNDVLAYDKQTHRLHRFDLESKSLKESYLLEKDMSDFTVYQNSSNPYILLFGAKRIQVQQSNGNIIKNPASIAGTPKYIAAKPDSNVYVIVDDLGSIAILKLNTDGSLNQQFVGGPVIENEIITAGNLVDENSLVLINSSGTILKIDINASITNQKWEYQNYTLENQTPTEFFPLSSTHGVIKNKNRLLTVVNISDFSISSQDTEEYQTCDSFSESNWFFICKYADKNVLVTLDENNTLKKDTSTLADASVRKAQISSDRSQITAILGSDNRGKRIIRVRLVDSLPLFNFEMDGTSTIGLSQNYIAEIFESPLGYVKVRPFTDTEDVQEIAGFNRQYLE